MAARNENKRPQSRKLISATKRPENYFRSKIITSRQVLNSYDAKKSTTDSNNESSNGPTICHLDSVKARPSKNINQFSPRGKDRQQQYASFGKIHRHSEARSLLRKKSGDSEESPLNTGQPRTLQASPNLNIVFHAGQDPFTDVKSKSAATKMRPQRRREERKNSEQRQPVSRFDGGKEISVSGMLAHQKNYTVKPIIPAQTAELIDVARAMNRDQFASRVKKLFDPEREAALQALETGIYIGWRCFGHDFDCIRVSTTSKCFCDHLLEDHTAYQKWGRKDLNCKINGCSCKTFAFIPSRPEEIGEWWLQKRPGFDVNSWRAKCRCKHTHVQHNPNNNRRCKVKSCSCFNFDSNFLCAACDKHWEDHDTYFDDINSRKEKGLPYGEEYLPFHELPQLRNLVLTGNENDDAQYNALTSGPYAIPRPRPTNLALKLRGDEFEGASNTRG